MMKSLALVFGAMATLLLAACGGGGGSPGGSGGTGGSGGGTGSNAPIVMSLALSSSTASVGTPIEVRATVQTSQGVAISNAVVEFKTKLNLGSFNPAAGTALTNSSGVASILLSPKDAATSGADEIEATVTFQGVTVSATRGFQLTATNASISKIETDVSSLAAYGQTGVRAVLSGTVSGQSIQVALTSNCGAKATIEPATATTSSGTANFTFIDNGCGAERSQVTFTANIVGSASSATGVMGISVPTASSLRFDSATPSQIFLRGSGFNEVSVVTFVVVDQGGNPFPNQTAELDLTTFVGGLTINDRTVPIRLQSDANGKISVRINSGTVPTPVRVRASLLRADGTVAGASVSSNLNVGVGLPSQRNFSLSQKACNIEAAARDGTSNTYSVILSDRSGNPVPDGTAVSFVTEGGQIQSRAVTVTTNGLSGATAAFQSSEPRPFADNRVTITAYAVGEESFIDANGNNVWDSGEAFQDLGDVYKDTNNNGAFDNGEELFPFGKTGTCAPVTNSLLDYVTGGIGLQVSNTCDGTWGRAFVRRSIETVFSNGGTPVMLVAAGSGARDITLNALANGAVSPVTFGDLGGASFTVPLSAADRANCDAAIRAIRDGGSQLASSTTTINGVRVEYIPGATNPADDLPTRQAAAFSGSSRRCFSVGGVVTIPFLLHDGHPRRANPMPAGTKIAVEGVGSTVTIGSDSVPSSCEPTANALSIERSAAVSTAIIKFESPQGVKTAISLTVSSEVYTPPLP